MKVKTFYLHIKNVMATIEPRMARVMYELAWLNSSRSTENKLDNIPNGNSIYLLPLSAHHVTASENNYWVNTDMQTHTVSHKWWTHQLNYILCPNIVITIS